MTYKEVMLGDLGTMEPNMEPLTLHVYYEEPSSRLYWQTRTYPHIDIAYRSIGPEEFRSCLGAFRTAWQKACDETAQGQPEAGKAILESARKVLQMTFLPEALDLEELGEPGDFLDVAVEPDDFPIEVFSAGGLPVNCYYRCLHSKVGRGNGSRATAPVSASPALPPLAVVSYTNNILQHGSRGPGDHARQINQCLAYLYGKYGQQGPFAPPNLDPGRLASLFRTGRQGCAYHLGHGVVVNGKGRLDLEKDALDVESLARGLEQDGGGHGGFALVNSCHSAATGEGELDIIRMLLRHGYDAALGAVLPPLDTHGAALAEELFKERLPYTACDLAEAVHQTLAASWQRYDSGQGDNRLAWACCRLYGSFSRRFLRTRVTEPDGRVVLRTERSELIVGSLMPGSERPVSPEQLRLLLDLLARFDRQGIVVPSLPQVIVGLNGDDQFKSMAASLVQEVLRDRTAEGIERARQIMDDDLLSVIQSAAVNVPESGEVRIGDIQAAVEQRYDQKPSQAMQQARSALYVSQEVGALLAELFLPQDDGFTPQGAIRLQELIEHFLPPGPPKLRHERSRTKYTSEPAADEVVRGIHDILRLAWKIARENNSAQVRERHLFVAVIARAFIQATRFEDLARMSRTIIWPADLRSVFSDVATPPALPGPDKLSHAVVALLDEARTDFLAQPRRPLWEHLFASLCSCSDEAVKKVRSQLALNPQNLRELVHLVRNAQDVGKVVPTLREIGTLVGTSRDQLPASAAEKVWHATLENVARALGEKRPVLLVVPWEPGARKLVDGLAWHIFTRASATGIYLKDRKWLHVPAQALENGTSLWSWLKPGQARDGRLSKKETREVIKEARQRALLCIDGLEFWHDVAAKGIKKSVRWAFDAISQPCPENSMPTLMLLSLPHHNRHGHKHWFPRLCDDRPPPQLEPLDDSDLRQFLIELDGRHDVSAEDISYQLAMTAIVKEACKRAAEERLGRAVWLFEKAQEFARAQDEKRPITEKDVESALLRPATSS